MKSIKLSNRLGAIAAFIGGGRLGVIDVGTDHGYLPVWLAQHDCARRISATDIRKGPLSRARISAEDYGVSDRIEFILTDGLEGLDGAEYDSVVIAGMGGETIMGILEKAPWTQEKRVQLILQPQTKQDELISWLSRSGYAISDTVLAEDEGRIYIIIKAGENRSTDDTAPLRILLEKEDPLLPAYLSGLITKTRRMLDGLKKSENPPPDTVRRLETTLANYEVIREETEKWQK